MPLVGHDAPPRSGNHVLTAVARDAGWPSHHVGRTWPSRCRTRRASPRCYPGDVGIETNPDVVFVERFDEATLDDALQPMDRHPQRRRRMTFSSDVPPGSPAPRSLNIPWVGGGVSSGGHLYKAAQPGRRRHALRALLHQVPDERPVRAPRDLDGRLQSAAQLAESRRRALKPAGNDLFSGGRRDRTTRTLRIDHYDYWMDMHQSNDGNYWGNLLLNNPSVLGKAGQWMCVEQMVKLNNSGHALRTASMRSGSMASESATSVRDSRTAPGPAASSRRVRPALRSADCGGGATRA